MLYNIERTIARMEKSKKSDEYRDLVYDLESFIIDNCTEAENSESKALGILKIRDEVAYENERDFVFSKLRPVLCELEIPESVKGFRMLEELVLECAKITLSGNGYYVNEVYPIVAARFSTNAHNCERLCRYACDSANPTLRFAAKYPCLEQLTHRTFEKVTVKELVDNLVWYLITKCKFKRKIFGNK